MADNCSQSAHFTTFTHHTRTHTYKCSLIIMKLSAVESVSYRKQEEYQFQKFGFEGVWKFEYFFDMGTLLNKNI